jgi:hypothetical protein
MSPYRKRKRPLRGICVAVGAFSPIRPNVERTEIGDSQPPGGPPHPYGIEGGIRSEGKEITAHRHVCWTTAMLSSCNLIRSAAGMPLT